MPDPLDILSGRDRSPVAALTRLGLACVEPGYAAAAALRNAAFTAGIKRSHALGRPTISIGNLTTGGTGKTPMVITTCQLLRGLGYEPAVLTRGYRGGDEAREIAAALDPPLHVQINPDRIAGAADALAGNDGIQAFVLDDGFQHRRARRDLDIVLIDATNPWGYNHILPRGLLREPVAGILRADAVIVTRADRVDAETLADLDAMIEQRHGRPPLAHAAHTWTALLERDTTHPIETLTPLNVLGVSGIGNPEAFERMLAQQTDADPAFVRHDDHHAYTANELRDLFERAVDAGHEAIVTTEKDFVKWRELLDANSELTPPCPIYRPQLGIRFLDGEEAFAKLLKETTEQNL